MQEVGYRVLVFPMDLFNLMKFRFQREKLYLTPCIQQCNLEIGCKQTRMSDCRFKTPS